MPDSKLTELLASYVPKLIQSRVVENPAPIESPVSEQLQAAILFADISGFTRLTERLAEKGPSGVESLARILNEYFGQLIDIVHEYGGDVVKFAGDAVTVIWNIPANADPRDLNDQRQWTLRATECALKIRERLTNYQAEDEKLYLKLAVSTGSIVSAHVGGVFNRWEFLLTGNPLVELGIANNLAKAGEIIIAPSAWRLIRNDSSAEPIEFELKDAIAQGGRLNNLNKSSGISSSNEKINIPDEAENYLRAYIPGAIINRLSAGQSSWLAELRRVTILFINLPDINQDTDLEESQKIARLIQRSVYRYEGSINKISVDDKGITIVAALGLPPFSHEDDPARGLRTALMIRKEFESLKVRSNIGVATGHIFCGSIGNDSRREYTIIGNAVNLSARLMGVAGDQHEIIRKYSIPILCDRATFDSAKDAVEFEILPAKHVKGRTEAVEVFHPLELKKSVIRPTTELIGRQEEKTIIANALQELSRGVPSQTIILQGEAGIGKSRLFEDLVRQAETLQVALYNGGGDPIEKSNPYHAWRPIFNKIFKIEDLISKIESLDESRGAIEKRVADVLSAIDPDLIRYISLLDVLLPIQIPDNELTSVMIGEIRGNNIREILTRVLSYTASQTPLLIVMEDLHWFDSASWMLLLNVEQKVRPLLLALNTRPLSDPIPVQFKQLMDSANTRLLKLEAMMLDDVEALVCQRLGVKSVPPMIGRLIREKSEGHPFFAEELAYAMRESGVLQIEDQVCKINPRFANLEDLSLPNTLQAAITNRIDSLNPSQQLTLKVASVIGRIFSFRLLEAVHPIEADRPVLPDYMQTLTRLSLTLIESDAPDLAYIFKHAVTQEVAYNLMLFSQRRMLHQAVAESIERNNPNNLESFYPLLSHHWTQAAEVYDAARNNHAIEKAVEYLDKAGEQVMQNYANNEAIQFFSAAIEWEAKLPKPEDALVASQRTLQRARWHSRIGLAQYGRGSLPECERYTRKALRILGKPIPSSTLQFILNFLWELIRQTLHRTFPNYYLGKAKGIKRETALEIGRLYELMSRVYFYSHQTLPVLYTGLRFVNEVEKAGPSPELASAYAGLGVMGGFAQLHPLAERYVDRALRVSKAINQPATTITTNIVTSVYHMAVAKWDDVRTKAQEAFDLCVALGDSRQWGDAISLLAEGAYLSGNYSEGLRLQKKLLEDGRRRNSPLHIVWGLSGIAANLLRQGQDEACIPLFEEALEILEENSNLAASININAQLALIYQRLGDKQKADAYAAETFKLAEGKSPTDYAVQIAYAAINETYFVEWETLLATGGADTARAKSSAGRALKMLYGYKNVFPIGQGFASYYQGLHHALSGKPAAARKVWQSGIGAVQKLNQPYEEALIRARLGVIETDSTKRADHFARAITLFETCGALGELNKIKETASRYN